MRLIRISFRFCFSFYLIFISCNKSSEKNEIKNIGLLIDSIVIPIDSLCKEIYNVFSINNASNQYLGYNSSTNSIDVFDIESSRLLGHIKLATEGPNGIIGNLNGIEYYNKDSIFVVTQEYIYIIDSEGQVKLSINIAEQKGKNFRSNGIQLINEYFKLHFFGESGEIYFQNLYPTEFVNKYIDSSTVSVFILKDKKFEKTPVKFSEIFKEKDGKVGFLRWMNFESYKGDSLFFNSQFDDILTIYDKKLKVTRNISLNKEPEVELIENNIDAKAWVEHAVSNTHRFALLYDKWRDLYYRFVWEGVPVKISDKLYNSMLDKPLFLEVYDKNLHFLSKIRLPDYILMINTWFVGKNGIYINPSHPQSNKIEENKLKFEILKIRFY